MAKKKQNTALTWIIKEAKHLRTKDGNRKEWKTYVKQASGLYKQKHKAKSPVKHKKNVSAKSVTGIRKVNRPARKVLVGTVSQHLSIAKKGLESKLSDKMLQQYKATTKTAKRKLGKEITQLKSQIRKLS
jgi:thymidylate synthase